ncbi:uncharacterized protein JCM15063_002205 [Sporobolomyces koalae]|uniref:uncharacterized protein n=1 Tax=Sporobolomyces koalae TaxID=500713 RepID=UPI0031785108
MADSITDLYASLSSMWDSLVPAEGLPNLHSLPHQLHEALFAPGGVFDKLTNGGTVPLPVPSSWLEAVAPAPAAPPSPPPASSGRTPQWALDVCSHLLRHPYVYALASASLVTGATSYYSPRSLDPLVSLLPAAILPPPKHRPLRLLPAVHKVAAEIRKEAALVLGADSPEGREIALDLEKRGWVVIATVSDPDHVDKLEKEGRGWIKVLVLDPSQSSSVPPFLRSLSTALSLRFPLHTSGDPFSRPAHALALTSLIDCLALAPASVSPALAPLEALEPERIKRDLTERISTFVLVTKGVLPFLRTSGQRPGAPTSVFLFLLPSQSANVSLPFSSLSSTLSQSLSSLFHSLRRELQLATPRPNLQLTILQTGTFEHRIANAPSSIPSAPALPIRLSSLYAPALSRRTTSSRIRRLDGEAGSPTSRLLARTATPVRALTHKVSLLLLRPSNAPIVSLSGSGSWISYYLTTFTSHLFVDIVIRSRDRLIERYIDGMHRIKRITGSRETRRLGEGQGEEGQVPESLRPANSSRPPASQVPVKDAFVPPPASPLVGRRAPTQERSSRAGSSTTASSSASASGDAASEDDGGDTSSIEDLGISTGSLGRGTESLYGTGSFVEV